MHDNSTQLLIFKVLYVVEYNKCIIIYSSLHRYLKKFRKYFKILTLRFFPLYKVTEERFEISKANALE